ncbi:hypothetical protein [Zavarzinella formosa]|uniref:hypothetical protein n=1 Tax=Zavarzinella formosa TaxID=360055 RepID=UPI0012F9D4B3|nr:hypothetical protein [Zavarzinella formosa]
MSDHPAYSTEAFSPSEEAEEPPPFEPDHDLPGAVMMIPNSHWGFEVVSATDHPGACVNYLPASREGVLVQGTDAENVRYPRTYLTVSPTVENGLFKDTAFKLVPRYFRLHKLKLYFPQRHIGSLGGTTLQHLRDELARLNPEE